MIKASVIISSYNCNEALPNTFYAISRQKTDFDFEVCFLDDCSYESPKFIYDYFLRVKHKRGVRLKQHIGSIGERKNFPNYNFKNSFSMLLDLVSAESEIIILNHGDVIMCSDNTIQTFVDEVEHRCVKVPDVRTISVAKDLYIDFESPVNKILNNFDNTGYLYQGANRDSLGLILTCLYKKDLYEIEFDKNPHEFTLKAKMERLGYKIIKQDKVKGIHQQHVGRASIHFTTQGQALNWSDKYPEKEIL